MTRNDCVDCCELASELGTCQIENKRLLKALIEENDKVLKLFAERNMLRKAVEEAAINAGKYEDWLAQKIGQTYDDLPADQRFSLGEFGFFELIEQSKRIRMLCRTALAIEPLEEEVAK